MDNFSILIGGKAGFGIDKSGAIIGRLLNQLGYRIYIYRDYPSLIRGGHTFSIIRASKERIAAHKDKVDIILALNQDVVNFHRDRLKDDSLIIYDSDSVKLEDLPSRIKTTGIGLSTIIKEENAPEIMRNTCIIGALAEIIKLCPKAKVFGTAKCKEGLHKHYYLNLDFQVVKTGDKLKLGKRTLTFIEAPMIHWPDSMFAYCPEEQLLLPNDAFGQHYATSERFDDEVDTATLMDEAAKYYGNILWPLSSLILRKIEEVQKLNIPIKMIAPSHGIIWRKDSMKIINAYVSWARNETKPKAVVVYETMWGATEKMARRMVEGITDRGLSVKLFDIAQSDRTEIIKEMLDAKGYMIGSSTHDNGMLTNIAGFLEFLKGLKPRNRVAAVFGSYGWGGGAIKAIENVLKETGIEIVQPSLGVQYVPDENEIKRCYEYGIAFANRLKEG